MSEHPMSAANELLVSVEDRAVSSVFKAMEDLGAVHLNRAQMGWVFRDCIIGDEYLRARINYYMGRPS